MKLPRLRLVFAVCFCFAGIFLALDVFAQRVKLAKVSAVAWPSLDHQLAQEYLGHAVATGSALDKLIRANQDFSILREEEKADRLNFPPWLRVWWRKNHPEGNYSSDDPTGGYPRVLNEILEWMLTHQDLKAGPGLETTRSVAEPDATVGSNVRVSGLQSVPRSESDIRINYWDSSKIISASNNIGGSGLQSIYYTSNGGTSWGQTTLPAGADAFHSDPAVDWTSDGKAWSQTLGINSAGTVLHVRNFISTDNGATWTLEATPSGTQTSVDKELMWVDHSASSPYQNRIYAIWHNNNPAFMNRRTAGAAGTWLASPIQVSGAQTTGTAIGADVKTNSAGDVFGAWPDTGSRKLFVVKSTNGGDSYGTPVAIATTYDSYDIGVPSFSSRRILIYVSLGAYRSGATNNVYATWTDLSGASGCTSSANEPGTSVSSTCKTRIWFARSIDGGATWSAPIKINDQASLNDQFNQWMAVDETNGTVAITYYDTVNDAGRKKTDVYYQSSSNAGASWSIPQKVTTGTTDETSSGADSGNQYGDYNAMSGYNTLFLPSWTDRRNAASEEIWTSRIVDSPTAAAAVSSNGATITAANCGNPTTATIDPGETVTLNICARNDGNLATANAVGTLLATGGVTNPSAPQTYGAISANGGSVCRSFTFTASGSCGGTLTASVQLQDGATNLGTLTYTYTMGAVVTASAESFDGVTAPALPPNWVAANASGAAPLWVTSTSTADSGANDAFVDDPATVSDKRLDSAPIAIASTQATLTFRNNYNLESTFDGGVLEVSSPNINGGAFTDITNAAVGGSFTSGGYTGTISASYSNPIGGRQAWSGNSGGYITTVAKLGPNVAGQTIKLRFRMGSDNSTAGTGWRIDGLTVQDGVKCVCAPVPLSVVSRHSHNGQNFDIDLPLSGSVGIEPRSGGAGGNHQIVITFASPVSAGSASVDSGGGNITNFNVSGAQLTINLDGVVDGQKIIVSANGASDGSNVGNLSIPIAFLAGDVNGDGMVNAADATAVRNRSGQALDATNFRADLNSDGFVNSADSTIARAKSGNALP